MVRKSQKTFLHRLKMNIEKTREMASRVEAQKLTPRKNRNSQLQCQTSGAFFHHVIRASSSESVRELFRVFGSANHITTLCVVNPLHTQEDSVCQTRQRMYGRTWTES